MTSWNLPKDMDEHTRAARVSELLSTVRANGRDLPVVNDPAPHPAGVARSVTAGAPPASTVTTLSTPSRAAIGCIDLRRPSSISPRRYSPAVTR